jgi:hypothetical protein
MQNNVTDFIIDSEMIDKFFENYNNKNPFHLKAELKELYKSSNIQSYKDFIAHLGDEIQAAYINSKKGDYIYHCNQNFRIAILKFRMKDISTNSGKSSGLRIVALIDEISNLCIVLSLYKHSKGNDNITKEEHERLKKLCNEYILKNYGED